MRPDLAVSMQSVIICAGFLAFSALLVGALVVVRRRQAARGNRQQDKTHELDEKQDAENRACQERTANAVITILQSRLTSVERQLNRPRIRTPIFGPPPASNFPPQLSEPPVPGIHMPRTEYSADPSSSVFQERPLLGWQERDDPSRDTRTTRFTIEERPDYVFFVDDWIDGIQDRGLMVGMKVYEDDQGLFHAELVPPTHKLRVEYAVRPSDNSS